MIKLHPKKIFLLDCFGALLSAISLGVVLPLFDSFFGLPNTILYSLAITALIFGIYSLVCYLFVRKSWRVWLLIIALANTFYALLSIIILFIFSQYLTFFDGLYFIIELVILALLIILEFKIYFSLKN
jgi:hypothetical protein